MIPFVNTFHYFGCNSPPGQQHCTNQNKEHFLTEILLRRWHRGSWSGWWTGLTHDSLGKIIKYIRRGKDQKGKKQRKQKKHTHKRDKDMRYQSAEQINVNIKYLNEDSEINGTSIANYACKNRPQMIFVFVGKDRAN